VGGCSKKKERGFHDLGRGTLCYKGQGGQRKTTGKTEPRSQRHRAAANQNRQGLIDRPGINEKSKKPERGKEKQSLKNPRVRKDADKVMRGNDPSKGKKGGVGKRGVSRVWGSAPTRCSFKRGRERRKGVQLKRPQIAKKRSVEANRPATKQMGTRSSREKKKCGKRNESGPKEGNRKKNVG